MLDLRSGIHIPLLLNLKKDKQTDGETDTQTRALIHTHAAREMEIQV